MRKRELVGKHKLISIAHAVALSQFFGDFEQKRRSLEIFNPGRDACSSYLLSKECCLESFNIRPTIFLTQKDEERTWDENE